MSVHRENIVSVKIKNGVQERSFPMGMREMQYRAFEKRGSQYLLIKAPPACGKSRALMYLALDKLHHQGLKKVIIAVPQMVISSSFKNVKLTDDGFFADWKIEPKYNLCVSGTETSKAQTLLEFMQDPKDGCLVCAHPTLIRYFELAKKSAEDFRLLDKALIAIDEFHHVSQDDSNQLGGVIHSVMNNTAAHLVAMTGSYFRGDQVPILSSEDERKFDKVTYTYYEQLSAYKHLKSLSIDYAFYEGQWTDAIAEVLDLSKKTILHIPSVNSRESTKDKLNEVGLILDCIGTSEGQDQETGIHTRRTKDGRLLRVADLVSGADIGMQAVTLNYLRGVKNRDDVDIIIALGMAKEGFDWPWCETALTVGYRNSLTEVIQIIGRATRDCEGKEKAQFINLIAKPEALQADVETAVNSLLKAITLSLLMEQVLAPNVHFRVRKDEEEDSGSYKFEINDQEYLLSADAKKLLEEGLTDAVQDIITKSPEVQASLSSLNNEIMQQLKDEIIPEHLLNINPNLTDQELEALTWAALAKLGYPSLVRNKSGAEQHPGSSDADDERSSSSGAHQQAEAGKGPKNPAPGGMIEEEEDKSVLIDASKKFINVDELDFSLIMSINPFKGAYEILSRSIDSKVLKVIQDQAVSRRAHVTEQEALLLWPRIKEFVIENHYEPSPNSADNYERRLGEVLAYVRSKKAESLRNQQRENSHA